MLAFSKCQLVSERTVHEEGYLSTCEKNTGYLHSTWVGAGGGGEKESIGFHTKWPSRLPPLPTLAPEVPQVSLRDPVSIGPLRSERSVHHSQWILSVLLPPDKSNAAKQNNCEKGKTPCGRPTPQPPPHPSVNRNMLDWVCYPTGALPITQSLTQLLYTNPESGRMCSCSLQAKALILISLLLNPTHVTSSFETRHYENCFILASYEESLSTCSSWDLGLSGIKPRTFSLAVWDPPTALIESRNSNTRQYDESYLRHTTGNVFFIYKYIYM